MNILGVKCTHDGSCCSILDGKLEYSIENEKDSQIRSSTLNSRVLLRALLQSRTPPDVIAISGWGTNIGISGALDAEGGYIGIGPGKVVRRQLMGKDVEIFFSSHERSHILGAFGMSDFPLRTPSYILVWEGTIGRFYEMTGGGEILRYPTVVSHPGQRYEHLYFLGSADRLHNRAMAGKLMALAGCHERFPLTPAESRLITLLLADSINEPYAGSIDRLLPKRSQDLGIPWINGGLTSPEFRSFAHHFSEEIFNRFFSFAREKLLKRYPLIIAGGCALNCEWNTKWRDCGLFPEVYVPPCPNDCGSAIGTAIDAQLHFTGSSKIDWTVYSGENFEDDCGAQPTWLETSLDFGIVAARLKDGEIVAWVQGRYEIGPRALGNRSLLAAPFSRATTQRLNQIKKREMYRPIAPICLEEDVSKHFNWKGPSEHMLYFQQVTDPRLDAITHDDGSARVQTVNHGQNPTIYRLLKTFKTLTGVGVLCNTSLNFKGCGFINRKSHLLQFADSVNIRTAVYNNTMTTKIRATDSTG